MNVIFTKSQAALHDATSSLFLLEARQRVQVRVPLPAGFDRYRTAHEATEATGRTLRLRGTPHVITAVRIDGDAATVTLERGDGVTRILPPGGRAWFGRVQLVAPYAPLADGAVVRALGRAGLRPTPPRHYAGFVGTESALTLWRGPVGAVARWWYRRRDL